MNDRIQKLKLQAIKLVAESYPCDIEDFTDALDERVRAKVDEKFAELIVQECLGIIDEEGSHEGGSIRSMEAIKEHFGVEE